MNQIAHWHQPELALLERQELLLETVEQIKKDFLQNGLTLGFEADQLVDYPSLLHALEQALQWLLERDEQRLMSLLYRIDLGEEKLKKSMLQHENESLSNLLAKLIVQREAQKVLIRHHFKTSPPSHA